jgi:hypothetical protein
MLGISKVFTNFVYGLQEKAKNIKRKEASLSSVSSRSPNHKNPSPSLPQPLSHSGARVLATSEEERVPAICFEHTKAHPTYASTKQT